MMRSGSFETALGTRRHLTLPNGTGYWRSEIIDSPVVEVDSPVVEVDSPARASPSPQAFLVEQDPSSLIVSHFHLQNEFQVVVQGEGSLGRHPVRPLAVHYAGAHTGYGPITSGAEGLAYLTLRPRMDLGAQFLPEARAKMNPRAPKRHLLGSAVELSDEPSLSARTTSALEPVLEAQADGIAGWLLRLPASTAMRAPEPASGDRFYVVMRGALDWNGEQLTRLGTVFTSAEEPSSELCAGERGLELLILQFPSDRPHPAT